MGTTIVKQVEDGLFYDSKNYWKPKGDRMYGYDKVKQKTLDHIWKPIETFQFFPQQVETKMQPVKEVPIITNPALDALDCGS